MNTRALLSGVKQILALKNAVLSLYKKNPRVANALTGGLTFSMGDIVAQKLELSKNETHKEVDLWRASQVGLLGLVMNGIFLHYWYNTLDRVVGSSMTSKIGVAIKVAADQLIYAPFSIGTFFYFTSFRNSGDIAQSNEEFVIKMEKKFVPTFLADCVLWPTANFVNFRYVSLPFRPSFTAIVQLLWQSYLSVTSSGNTSIKTGHTAPSANLASTVRNKTIAIEEVTLNSRDVPAL